MIETDEMLMESRAMVKSESIAMITITPNNIITEATAEQASVNLPEGFDGRTNSVSLKLKILSNQFISYESAPSSR